MDDLAVSRTGGGTNVVLGLQHNHFVVAHGQATSHGKAHHSCMQCTMRIVSLVTKYLQHAKLQVKVAPAPITTAHVAGHGVAWQRCLLMAATRCCAISSWDVIRSFQAQQELQDTLIKSLDVLQSLRHLY